MVRRYEPRNCLLFVLIGCALLSACVKNPVTGRRQLALLSEGQEIAIGQESHPEILAQFGTVDNTDLQQYCARIGNELARVSHRPDLPWIFTVADSPVANAFALPAGYIYITRGILQHMNNEAELAGGLGHEIGHLTARPSVTQISQGQLLNLGLGLGSVFSSTFRQVGGLAQMGMEVLMLKYSRDHERESDHLGLQYMAQCGYDPEQMSEFFQVFAGMREESGESIPNWLSSHPSPPDRIQRTSLEGARIKAASGNRSFKVNADQFLPKLDSLIFGENPREGFVDNGRFIHPDLRFQMDIPQGWEVENTKSVVVFAEPQGRAMVELSMVPPDAGRTPDTTFSQYSRSLNSVLRSFREITDQRQLSVQPDRIKIQRARKGDTLRNLAKGASQSSRVTLEDLVRINRIDPDRPLSAGAMVKLIQPGRR